MYTSDKLLIVSFSRCMHVSIYDLCPSFYTHFLPFSCLITFTYIPSKHSVIFFSSPFRHYISHFVRPISFLYTYTYMLIQTFIHFDYAHALISPFTLLLTISIWWFSLLFVLFYWNGILFYRSISFYEDFLNKQTSQHILIIWHESKCIDNIQFFFVVFLSNVKPTGHE